MRKSLILLISIFLVTMPVATNAGGRGGGAAPVATNAEVKGEGGVTQQTVAKGKAKTKIIWGSGTIRFRGRRVPIT